MTGLKRIWWLIPVFTGAFVASLASADERKDQPSTPAPEGAKILFDGKSLDGWVSLGGHPARWTVQDGYLQVKPGTGDIRTEQKVGLDYKLHLEFWLPLMPQAHGQGRANSGVYLQGRYEIQVLDNYHNTTYNDGSIGAMYKVITPDPKAQAQAIKPPEQWQTYDITFHAPRVNKEGKVIQAGHITVVLNGVPIIENGKFEQTTPGAMDQKIGTPGPLRLQDHGCKVRYRNIWLRSLEPAPQRGQRTIR